MSKEIEELEKKLKEAKNKGTEVLELSELSGIKLEEKEKFKGEFKFKIGKDLFTAEYSISEGDMVTMLEISEIFKTLDKENDVNEIIEKGTFATINAFIDDTIKVYNSSGTKVKIKKTIQKIYLVTATLNIIEKKLNEQNSK